MIALSFKSQFLNQKLCIQDQDQVCCIQDQVCYHLTFKILIYQVFVFKIKSVTIYLLKSSSIIVYCLFSAVSCGFIPLEVLVAQLC